MALELTRELVKSATGELQGDEVDQFVRDHQVEFQSENIEDPGMAREWIRVVAKAVRAPRE